jgi:hypothetical protein
MRGPSPHLRPPLSPGKPSARAAFRMSARGREGGRDSAQHQPVSQPGSLTRPYTHDGRVVAAFLRRRPPRERSLAAVSCAHTPRDGWGGVLCRPGSGFRSASKRNPGRERPRLWPRGLAHGHSGSFTSWVPGALFVAKMWAAFPATRAQECDPPSVRRTRHFDASKRCGERASSWRLAGDQDDILSRGSRRFRPQIARRSSNRDGRSVIRLCGSDGARQGSPPSRRRCATLTCAMRSRLVSICRSVHPRSMRRQAR